MRDKLGENLRQKLWAEHQPGGGAMPEDDGEAVRPLASKLMQWVGGLVSLLLVLGVIYWVFELGRRDANEVPVIQAMGGAARIEPKESGGRVVDNQGLQVNEVLAGNETPPVEPETRLAPPPQRVVAEDTVASQPEILTPVDPTQPEASPQPEVVVAAPASEPFVMPPSLPGADPDMRRPVRRTPLAAALSPNAELLSNAIADAISEVVNEGAATQAQPEENSGPAASPEVLTAPTSPPPAAAPSEIAGERMIQLGVYDDEPSAARDWEALVVDNQDIMGNLTPFIERREAGGRVFYRLRARGFENMEEASDMCTILLAREIQCIAMTVR